MSILKSQIIYFFVPCLLWKKKCVILVGMKRAIHMAVGKCSVGKRNTLLGERIGLYFQAMQEARLPGQLKKAG